MSTSLQQKLIQDSYDQATQAALSEIDEGFRYSVSERRILKHMCETSGMRFARYFFKEREGTKFIVNQHHPIVNQALQDVLDGKIKRLLINIPPGYSKTELAVINFMARGLAINPRSKFIHLTYSDDLALTNSQATRDIIECDEYQQLWNIHIRKDTKAKKRWNTLQGGGVYATSTGGTVLGFRAGRMEPGFHGAMIIDDPLKPKDAYYEKVRSDINRRFNNAIKTRLALKTTPIIVIMQRLHESDPSGFLLRGGTGDKWHHILIPAVISKQSTKYPKEWTHGIPYGMERLKPGALWTYKNDLEELAMMEQVDPYTFAGQFMQRPSPLGGGIFKEKYWKYYEHPPTLRRKIIIADTAQKAKTHNDYSVFICAGLGVDNKMYVLDVLRGKWEAPELQQKAEQFYNKHRVNDKILRCNLSGMWVEDKVSGTGLIQQLRRKGLPVNEIPRHIDKTTRAMDAVPYIAAGLVLLPSGPTDYTDATWVLDYISEHTSFTPDDSHDFDDQIDPTMDGIELLLGSQGGVDYKALTSI